MAVTDIQATVLANTGMTPTANSVEDAQKYVAASIPKDLLKWASSQSGVMTSNADSDATLNVDTILSVKRNGYACEEISLDELVWAADSNSLKKATTSHPVYAISDGKFKYNQNQQLVKKVIIIM